MSSLLQVIEAVAPTAAERVGKYIQGRRIRREEEPQLILMSLLFEEIHGLNGGVQHMISLEKVNGAKLDALIEEK